MRSRAISIKTHPPTHHLPTVYSRITRESIDALKSHFKDELSNDDWRLVIDLKKVFGIL